LCCAISKTKKTIFGPTTLGHKFGRACMALSCVKCICRNESRCDEDSVRNSGTIYEQQLSSGAFVSFGRSGDEPCHPSPDPLIQIATKCAVRTGIQSKLQCITNRSPSPCQCVQSSPNINSTSETMKSWTGCNIQYICII